MRKYFQATFQAHPDGFLHNGHLVQMAFRHAVQKDTLMQIEVLSHVSHPEPGVEITGFSCKPSISGSSKDWGICMLKDFPEKIDVAFTEVKANAEVMIGAVWVGRERLYTCEYDDAVKVHPLGQDMYRLNFNAYSNAERTFDSMVLRVSFKEIQ